MNFIYYSKNVKKKKNNENCRDIICAEKSVNLQPKAYV